MTSARAARFTTSPPADASRNVKTSPLPHWPGDTHMSRPASISATSAKFVGLKTCLPRTRSVNLLAMAITAASTARSGDPVRSSRHSESPEMSALRGSKRSRPATRSHASWVASTLAMIATAFAGWTSRSSHQIP